LGGTRSLVPHWQLTSLCLLCFQSAFDVSRARSIFVGSSSVAAVLALSLIAMGVAPVSDAAPITLLPLFIAL
jgi:hypothetical protein